MTLLESRADFPRRWLKEFVAAPSSPQPLAIFRIGVALVLLAKAASLSGSILELFGQRGLIQWAISDTRTSPWLPRFSALAEVSRGLGLSEDHCVQGVYLLYMLGLAGLLLGWRTRLSALAAWFAHVTLLNSANMVTYGVESFGHISLFYCMVLPVGSALSLDRRAGRASDAPSAMATLSLRVLQLHLCAVYLASGVDKAVGQQWQSGEALWRALMQPQYGQFDFSWLASVPWLTKLATWGTLVIEIGYALLIWPRQTRALWVLATLGLHLGIALFMGLWTFSAIMSTMTFAAFGWNLCAPRWAPLAPALGRETVRAVPAVPLHPH